MSHVFTECRTRQLCVRGSDRALLHLKHILRYKTYLFLYLHLRLCFLRYFFATAVKMHLQSCSSCPQVLCVQMCMIYSVVCLASWPLCLEAARLRCGSDLLSDLIFVCGDRGIYIGESILISVHPPEELANKIQWTQENKMNSGTILAGPPPTGLIFSFFLNFKTFLIIHINLNISFFPMSFSCSSCNQHGEL